MCSCVQEKSVCCSRGGERRNNTPPWQAVTAVLAYEMEPDEEERMAALMFARKAAEASPTVVGAWLPLGRNGGTWMAIMAAQEAAEVSPTTVEAGPPPKQDEKTKRRWRP